MSTTHPERLVTVRLLTATQVALVTSATDSQRTAVSTCHHVYTERHRPKLRVGPDGTPVGTNPGAARWITLELGGKWYSSAAACHAAPGPIARKHSALHGECTRPI